MVILILFGEPRVQRRVLCSIHRLDAKSEKKKEDTSCQEGRYIG